MLILPKARLDPIPSPLIFLIGPIACAPPWHEEAIKVLHSLDPRVHVACPKPRPIGVVGDVLMSGTHPDFATRREWEWYYLLHAAKHGVILAWLPGPVKHDCDVVYGATTRLELGQWMTRASMDSRIHLCVGSDGSFPVISVIERDLHRHLPNFIMQPSLHATCAQAVQLLSVQSSLPGW